MRIVAGYNRGRILNSPKDDLIRPTSDKIRLAIFNMLNSRGAVVGAVVIDAFCGTGALGLEALSQGAAQAVFIDREKTSLDLAKKNAESLKETENVFFIQKNTAVLAERPAHLTPATLCFLDPPYNKGLIAPAINALKAGDWLAQGCWIVAESEKEFTPDFPVESEKRYGETKIMLLRL